MRLSGAVTLNRRGHTRICLPLPPSPAGAKQYVFVDVFPFLAAFSFCATMVERIEHRYFIKRCQLGNTQSETIRKVKQAFGDEAVLWM